MFNNLYTNLTPERDCNQEISELLGHLRVVKEMLETHHHGESLHSLEIYVKNVLDQYEEN